MGCIIIAIPKIEDAKRIAELIRKRDTEHEIYVCSSGSSVLREANQRDYGTVICTSHLKDINYTELFDQLPEYFAMIVLSKNTMIELSMQRMYCLGLPFKIGELIELVHTAFGDIVHFKRKKKKVQIKRTPEEQKIIDKAKAILIEKQGLSEPDAYRYIQKQSMDQGRTLVESAQMIILLNTTWE